MTEKETGLWVTAGDLGTNIGQVAFDDSGDLQFTPAGGSLSVIDNIINVINATNDGGSAGERVYINVEFCYTSGDNGGSLNSARAHCGPGKRVYLVVDVAGSVVIDVRLSTDGTSWSAPVPVTVHCSATLSPAGSIEVTTDANGNLVAPHAVVPLDNGSSFTVQNETGDVLDLWVNSRGGDLQSVAAEGSASVEMDQPGVGQWLVGFDTAADPDPTIVVRRPPVSSGARPE